MTETTSKNNKSFLVLFFKKERLPCLAFIAFLSFCALHALALPLYILFTAIPDGAYKPDPFPDMWAILQAGACWRRGVDVYLFNRCMDGGIYNYSPLFLRLGNLPLSGGDVLPFGLAQALAFIVSLSFLPEAPLRVMLPAVLSPSVYYALEQGNLDVTIFVAVLAAVLLLPRRPLVAYGVFAAAAALKFYPAALFTLALREPARRFWLLAGLAGGILAVIVTLFSSDIAAALRVLPSGTPFRATFGRIDLARGLIRPGILAEAVSWAMSGVAFLASAALSRRRDTLLRCLDPRHFNFLIAGAALMVLCFYAAQNVEYRAIFLLFTLPALSKLAHRDVRCRILIYAILLLLWEAAIRAAIHHQPHAIRMVFWVFRESVSWWVIIEFTAFLLAFVMCEAHRIGLESKGKIDESIAAR